MNLLNKRPLATVILAMLCALYVYGYTESIVAKVVMIVASVLFCLFIFIFSLIGRKRLTLYKIIAVSLLLTLLYAYVRFDYANPVDDYEGLEVVVVGEVEKVEELNDYTTALTVKTKQIDGINVEMRLITYAERTTVSHINAGSVVKYSCYIEEFSSDGDFNQKRYYKSEGYDAKTRDNGEIRRTGSVEPSLFSKIISQAREGLTSRINSATDEDTGALLSALLLGTKSLLPAQMKLDFTRIGCAHILALSGMHLAILSGFLEWLLSLLGVNKVLRKGLLIPFIAVYMLITGLPVSVVRAGFMLIISCLLFILVGARDPFTNLFISVGIICLITPEAIFSTSLLLSAFATLGIIALSILMKRKREKRLLPRLIFALCGVILASVFAISATMMICAADFDGISPFSIFISPIVSLICEIYLYIGGFALIFGRLLPLNGLLKPLYSLLSLLTSYFSDLELSYLSIDNVDTRALMLLASIFLFLFMVLRIKRKRAAIITVISLFLSVYFCAFGHFAVNRATDTAIYKAEGKSDVIVFNEGGEVTVIDSSNYTESSAYTVLEAVRSLGLLHIDNYVLTHYSADIEASIAKLGEIIDVDTIYLKAPECDTDEYFYTNLSAMVSSERRDIALWGNFLYIGDVSITALHDYNIEEEKARIALSVKCADYDLVYLSSGMLLTDTIKEATEYTSGADALILGRFGTAYDSLSYYGSKYATHDSVYIEGELVALSQKAYERYINEDKSVFTRKGYYVLNVK